MKLRIKYSILLMYIEILAIAEPTYIAEVSWPVHRAWQVLLILCCFLVAIDTLKERQSQPLMITGLLVIFVYTSILLSTVYHHGAVSQAVIRLITYPYCLFLSINCMKKDAAGYLQALKNVLFALTVINLLSVIFYRNGLYYVKMSDGSLDHRYWFLGFKNGMGKTCIIFIAISALVNSLNNNKKRISVLLSIIISYATVILVKSAGGFVGITLITALLLLEHYKYFSFLFNARNLAIIALTMLVMLLAGIFLVKSQVIQYTVINILRKNMTFSSRIYIWARVINIIKNNLFLGVGLQTGENNAKMIGITVHASDAHNYYLEFLFEGGLVTASLMGVFLYRIIKTLYRERNLNGAKISASALFALMIIFIFENCNNEFLWVFYGICSAIGYCQPHAEKQVECRNSLVRNIALKV